MENPIDSTKLVEEHGNYLLSFAMMKLGDLELAKDLVQDTFVSALTKLETFENRSTVRTWLTSILNRKIIDHWRKAETRYMDPASRFFSEEKKGHWIMESDRNADLETIEKKIITEERYQELRDCIGILPNKWKGVLVSKYFDEKDSEEICKELNITPSNLWVISHRAKLLLRECLEKKEDEKVS